MEDVVWSSLCV